MCGRYYFDIQRSKKLQRLSELLTNAGIPVKTGEVFPSDVTAVISGNQAQLALAGVKWGFSGFRPNQLVINARSESVTTKQMFKAPFLNNRCVFPMSGFYEWNSAKKKFLFTDPGDEVLLVGGFVRQEADGPRSIIMTTQPNGNVRPIHDRMPVLVDHDDLKRWLFDRQFALNLISKKMPALTVAVADGQSTN